jgi:hypothetical protein
VFKIGSYLRDAVRKVVGDLRPQQPGPDAEFAAGFSWNRLSGKEIIRCNALDIPANVR